MATTLGQACAHLQKLYQLFAANGVSLNQLELETGISRAWSSKFLIDMATDAANPRLKTLEGHTEKLETYARQLGLALSETA